ncbi:MAG TPA: YkvA family protein [Chthoniobacterales bacterium]|nr:YkvA family protein [Chthoniobacterales bacterium]
MHSKLEVEFAHALSSAKAYVRNPERLRDLVTEGTRKALFLPHETFKGTLVYLHAMLRLMRAYYRGEYRAVPMTTLLIIVAALIYLLNPLDMIPDWIPGLGFIDDAFILTLAARRTREVIEQFLAWESAHP